MGRTAIAFLLLGLTCGLAAEQRKAPRRPPVPAAASPLDRWNQMSPAQRDRALAKLPPDRQKSMIQRLDEFNRLPEAEKNRLRQRYARFSQMPQEKQELLRRQMRSFNQVPPDRRRVLAREIQNLRRLSDDDRRARVASEDFRGRYSAEEQQMLQDLSEYYPSLRNADGRPAARPKQ
ncbi:MAG: DUF3106 domain-containing protein [Bryobacteraceae bacterium]